MLAKRGLIFAENKMVIKYQAIVDAYFFLLRI